MKARRNLKKALLLFALLVLGAAATDNFVEIENPTHWRKDFFNVIADRKFMSLEEFDEKILKLMERRSLQGDEFKSETELAFNEGLVLLRPKRMEKHLGGREEIRKPQDLNQQLFLDGARVFQPPKLERHSSNIAGKSSLPTHIQEAQQKIDPNKHIGLNDAFKKMAAFKVDLNPDTKELIETGQVFRQLGKEDLQKAISASTGIIDSTDSASRIVQNIPLGTISSAATGALSTPKLVHGVAKVGRFVQGIVKSKEASSITQNWETLKNTETLIKRGEPHYEQNPNFGILDKRYGIAVSDCMEDVQEGMRRLALDKNLMGQKDFQDSLAAFSQKLKTLCRYTSDPKEAEAKKKTIVNEAIQLLRPEIAAKISSSPVIKELAKKEISRHPERGNLNQFTQILLAHAAQQEIEIYESILEGLEASQVMRSQSNWAKNPIAKNAKIALQAGFGINSAVIAGASLAGAGAVSAVATPIALGGLSIAAVPAVARTVKGIQNSFEMSMITEDYRTRHEGNESSLDDSSSDYEDEFF